MQVLFAFLLAVPFQQRFGEVSQFQKNVYFLTLICTAVASTLLIAPSAYHRVEFRNQDKEHIVAVANRFAIVGFGFLGLAMAGAILLVTDFLFGAVQSIVFAGGALVSFVLFWYVRPLRRREALRRERERVARARQESPARH